MDVVQAQPVFGSPYEPGREAMRAIEFGQGLRARQDAMQRQTAEYNREQQVRELLGSGRPEEAKKLMTLQERGQLVNIQGAMLNQKISSLELDMKEKAINDAYGLLDQATALNPGDDTFESRANSLVTKAAPLIASNPQYAAAFKGTIEAKSQERMTLYEKGAEAAMNELFKIRSGEPIGATDGAETEAPQASVWDRLNQWETDNAEVLAGPAGKRVQEARNNIVRELRVQSLAEKTAGGVNVDTMQFKPGQRVIDPTLGREVIWSNTITSIRDVETGLPLYIRIPDPNNQYEVINVRNPDLPWPEIEKQATGTSGTPVPDNLFDDTTFDRISS